MAAHPAEAANVRATNRSYMFFRVTGLSNEDEPIGAQGVPLTPGRSIAVDRVHEYGTPFFIEANLPIESVKPASPFRRLMIAQDTGSAIVGPARADLYLGAGEDAGRIAGRIRHPGRFVMLLPHELDMVAAGRQMPLPAPKPKIPGAEVSKPDGKGKADPANAGAIAAAKQMPLPKTKVPEIEARKQDGKGKPNSAGAGEIAAGRQKPLPVPKPKTPEIEVRKQDGKGKTDSVGAGAIPAGRQTASPVPKTKSPGIEVTKQDGKGKADSANAGEARRAAAKPDRQAASTRKSSPSLY
jgi:membrane-bound lytic murein transglycosylase A